jgi:hypothetical protein
MAQRQRCLERGERDCCRSWSPFASQSTNTRSLYTTVKSTTCVIVPWNVMWHMCPICHQFLILDRSWKIRFVSFTVSFKYHPPSVKYSCCAVLSNLCFCNTHDKVRNTIVGSTLYKKKSRNKGSVFIANMLSGYQPCHNWGNTNILET